jgi:hypothetical protein
MPALNEIERRNRAVVAFALLTGARDTALAGMRLGHVDLVAGSVFQDAHVVKTKFSKTFTTYFFPVGAEIRQIVDEWVRFLCEVRLWATTIRCFLRRASSGGREWSSRPWASSVRLGRRPRRSG